MAMEPDHDEIYMELALQQAAAAAEEGEVPVGCVIVREGEVLSRARNRRETDADPTAHAEIVALREAGRKVGGWRLEGATVYCTVEPCAMCAGALVNARVEGLVYGVADAKSGACGSVFDVPGHPRLNHRVEVRGGVLREEALALLRKFFSPRRQP